VHDERNDREQDENVYHDIRDVEEEQSRRPDKKQKNAYKQEWTQPHCNPPEFLFSAQLARFFDPSLNLNGCGGARFSGLLRLPGKTFLQRVDRPWAVAKSDISRSWYVQ
jgi:hypothetical protein